MLAGLFLCAVLGGCAFDATVPVGAPISCHSNEECPADLLCLKRLCRPRDADITAPFFDRPSSVSPSRVGPGATVEVRLHLSELVDTAVVTATRFDGRTLQLAVNEEPDDPRSMVATATVGPLDEGSWDLSARFVDVTGNAAELAPVGSFVVDASAPRLVPSETRITLVPSIDNPLAVVATVREGTQVRVQLSADEAILSIIARTGDGAIEVESVSGRFASLVADVGAVLDGPRSITVTWGDDLGNTRDETIVAAYTVDNTAPVLPADAAAALVFERAPFGTGEAGVARSFTLRSEGPTTLSAGSLIEVVDDKDPVFASPLGLAEVQLDGTVDPTRLAGVDRPLVYIRLVDEAGNRSSTTAVVPTVDWLLSGRAVAGRPAQLFIDGALRIDSGLVQTIPGTSKLVVDGRQMAENDAELAVLDADDQPRLRDELMGEVEVTESGRGSNPCTHSPAGIAWCVDVVGTFSAQVLCSPSVKRLWRLEIGWVGA